MKRLNNLIIISFIFSISVSAQDTLIIQPDGGYYGKDAFIDQLKPNQNFAEHLDFIAYDWTFSGTEGFGKSLIYLNLYQLPFNITIHSAKLSFFYNANTSSGGQAGTNACYLKPITSFWDEYSVTWNTSPSTTNNGAILLNTSTSSNQDYLNIDITNLVNDWHFGVTDNFGLMLELVNNTVYSSMKFCSSDVADSTKRPKLEIIYTISTGVDNFGIKNNNLKIHPNPVIDILTIHGEGIIEMYNSIGKNTFTEKVSGISKIDISQLSKGVYFYQLRTESGTATGKILKE